MKDDTIKQDNTRIDKPNIPVRIKRTPTKYYFIDNHGTPSKDNRTAEERNEDYWHPIKGAMERFKTSLRNKTNPITGIENTIMPALTGAALLTTPATVIGGITGGEIINRLTGGWGKWLEDKTGIPEEIGEYTNPGAIYGGAKGYNITKNKLASKFIKGDPELGWSKLDKNHWIFNNTSRTPTNIAMATANRIVPFLSNIEKTPLRVAAYKVGKRTNGNASVSLKDIKDNNSTYTGSSTPEGHNGDRNLLGLYLFSKDPIIKNTPWFKRIQKSFTSAKGGFSYGDRYSKLYPGIENRRYKMESVVEDSKPLRFSNIDEFNEYNKGIGKIQGKEGDMVISTDAGFQTFRQPGTNFVGPIDDVGGHLIKIDYNPKGKLTQISQDMWKFNPADYSKRWSGSSKAEAVRANKQAALMDKVGTPFILQQENPITIGTRRIWESLDKIPKTLKSRRVPIIQSGLITMKLGGQFTFKESELNKVAKRINKRDMRKKLIRSDRPTYNINRVRKGQDGLRFVTYTPSEDYSENTIYEDNVFSPYNIPTSSYNYKISYDIPKESSSENDIKILDYVPKESKISNESVNYKGLEDFNKIYDEVEKENPEARLYRKFLTKLAQQESGFNSNIQNKAGAPAYGYFQFMQDGKKYNNISAYAGTDINTFLNNPKLQIQAAIKLAKQFEKGFSKQDLEIAKQKGYTKFGLLGGAWLAGNGGVRKYLLGISNPSDTHWSKEGKGTNVADRIKLFNFE